MKAVQFSEYGGSDVLKIVEVDTPRPGPGQICITVRAAGVNPFDWKLRAGYMREFIPLPLPAGVGSEAAGIVSEIGEGVSDVAIGDAVFGYGKATVAEQAILTSWAHKPENMSFEVAGGLAVIAETATRALDQVKVKAGDTVLLAGAAGGVGTAAIQLARHRGATVIGTASEAKHAYIRELGAIPTSYEAGLPARVHELAPQGVEAALDLAGAGVLPDLVEIVGDPTRVVSIADITARQYGVAFSAQPIEHPAHAFAEAARLYTEGKFDLRIERTFPIEQIAQAHEVSAAGRVTGKLVITVA